MTDLELMRQADKAAGAAKPKKKRAAKPRLGSSPLRQSGEPLTYTVKEAAKRLGISSERGYAAVHAGQIPVIVLGKRRVVPAAALERMLAGEKVEAAA
jgi:excisionase family DNA binding protein